jgi:predicted transcriptional regulator
MMKERIKDELDRQLLKSIDKNQGSCISTIIRPFLLEKSETVLRQRIRALELEKLITVKRTKKERLIYKNSSEQLI